MGSAGPTTGWTSWWLATSSWQGVAPSPTTAFGSDREWGSPRPPSAPGGSTSSATDSCRERPPSGLRSQGEGDGDGKGEGVSMADGAETGAGGGVGEGGGSGAGNDTVILTSAPCSVRLP